MEKYQTFWPRFWAGWIDGLVLVPLGFVGLYLTDPECAPATIIICGSILYSSYWLYSVILHSRYGKTLGKMAMRVQVLDVQEDRIPTFGQAFLRDIGYVVVDTLSLIYLIYLVLAGEYVSDVEAASLPDQIFMWSALGWFFLGIITMLTNERRRALHDFIAKTVVVRV